ncbi:hypothetical protein O1O06_04910 [Grimontia hollisae]|uniref:hypothetical protein n=1 Tax=Grimontia hollisae TaxID=673 RepID=UPI0023DC2CD1|nr:hypothetical protein [Grimontia hollisae]MDF2184107.1 hypothetical protein [Grimontia hollisae]
MASNDKKHVNFSEDHELNNRLRNAGMRQTEQNRQMLKDIGAKEKKVLDKKRLTHEELDTAIGKNKSEFD